MSVEQRATRYEQCVVGASTIGTCVACLLALPWLTPGQTGLLVRFRVCLLPRRLLRRATQLRRRRTVSAVSVYLGRRPQSIRVSASPLFSRQP